MSNFYYRGQNHMSHMNSHPHQHHSGRSRRAHRQVKAVRTKEVVETVNMTNFRREFEAARAFEIEDDEIFCPFNLLTEDDVSHILVAQQAKQARATPAQQRKQYRASVRPTGQSPQHKAKHSHPFPLSPPDVQYYQYPFVPPTTITPPPDADIGTKQAAQLQSIGSPGSDRSSLSSGSPDQSPLQHQLQPTPSFVLSSATNFTPSYQQSTATTKIHQPLAQRQLKAIPIVDPSTRTVASPPPSVSPARQMQQQLMNRRGW